MAPNHAPEAEQEVAFVEAQVSVEAPPLATDVGFAVSDTVVAVATVTVADALAVPPVPVQARMNVLVVVSGPVDWPVVLESALAPTPHAPEEAQDVAFVDDQVSVEAPPLATDGGFAASDTVGAGGGGGMPDTVTPAQAFTIPVGPVQVRE